MQSFLPIAAESHFPIQNLPYGIFYRNRDGLLRVGVAIGEFVLDLALLAERGLLAGAHLHRGMFIGQKSLNAFMSGGRPAWRQARDIITRLLSADEPTLRDNAALRTQALVAMSETGMLLPVQIENYTDFYSSREHATNVGAMLRDPENALLPNWLHLPVAYHGRASSIVISGSDIIRPQGQTKADIAAMPSFGPSRTLDFELELGFFIGAGNELGAPIAIANAAEHVFGAVLVNDWSARDIQKWEYQPLGPFLSKNFATTISPWVVPFEALQAFRCPGPAQDPQPLPYLLIENNWAFDIDLEVWLQSEKMAGWQKICATNSKYLYWNVCQQVAHHTVGGCNLRPGDLLATGTISGPTPDSFGSMLELAWRGSAPITLRSGEKRSFLQDGDRITMTGWCQGNGYRVGFGELTGRIVPART